MIIRFKDCQVFSAEAVEIVFIVPIQRLTDFQIGQIDCPSALESFGWQASGLRNRFQVLGIDLDIKE